MVEPGIAALVVKTLVDGIKIIPNFPKWALPLVAIAAGGFVYPALQWDWTRVMTNEGFAIGAAAIGIHEGLSKLHERFNPPKDSKDLTAP